MRISSYATDDAVVLRLHCPRLDATVAHELRGALGEAILRAEGPMFLDLSDVSDMDSIGLAALLGAMRQPRSVTLLGVQPAVRAMLRLTRMDRVVRIVEWTNVASSGRGQVACDLAG